MKTENIKKLYEKYTEKTIILNSIKELEEQVEELKNDINKGLKENKIYSKFLEYCELNDLQFKSLSINRTDSFRKVISNKVNDTYYFTICFGIVDAMFCKKEITNFLNKIPSEFNIPTVFEIKPGIGSLKSK